MERRDKVLNAAVGADAETSRGVLSREAPLPHGERACRRDECSPLANRARGAFFGARW